MQGSKLESSTEEDLKPTMGLTYQFGNFQAFTHSKILTKNGVEVTIEPKVFDVLVYMCENAGHYVLLQELHDNVWQDRVVSDAAVRRSISKLRALLSEQDNQQYIKSQHKRGYKLNYEVMTSHGDYGDQVAAEETKYTASQTSPSKLIKRNVRKLTILVFVAVFAITLYLVSMLLKTDSSTINLLDFPGEKIHVAVSSDGNNLAFAGRVFDFQGYQLYVADTDTQKVRQITEEANNIVRASFSQDASSVFAVDMELGDSRLIKVALENSSQNTVEVLVDGFYMISDLDVADSQEGLYFAGVADKDRGSEVFFFSFESGETRKVTDSRTPDQHDYRVAVSPDSSLLAVATTQAQDFEQKITIYNTHNQSIKKRLLHSSPIFELVLDDMNNLFILDSSGLMQVQLDTGRRNIDSKTDLKGVIGIDRSRDGNFVALKEEKKDIIYIEISLPNYDSDSQKLIEKGDENIEQLAFANQQNSLLAIKKNPNGQQLVLRGNSNGQDKVLLETKMKIKIVDVSANGEHVLMFIDGLLAVFNLDSKSIDYISKGDEQLFIDGAFSINQTYIYYGSKVNNQWVTHRYSINDKNSEMLITGYKSLRELDSGYLLLDESDKLFLSTDKNDFSNIQPVEGISVEPPWHTNTEYVYWNNFDGKNIVFFAYHVPTQSVRSLQFSNSHIEHKFDVNHEGTKALLIRTSLPDTSIQQFKPSL